ncbi:hypothetical protein GPK34_00350 [Secundilactobacillus kimchicus]|uniref:hypothetical protein n=1 Tax=Secundilactobacillus kimchicus TaxID=528209 RepID=UPI001C01F31A|nr:hypothetical protein [Secundilactobacillus kimchicus]MBT9670487.1 hypothetical protein [Secundilactobacillus kimchicus]
MTKEITETKALAVAKQLNEESKETLRQVINSWGWNWHDKSIEHMDYVLRKMREDEDFQKDMIEDIHISYLGDVNLEDEYVLVDTLQKGTETSNDFTKWLKDDDYFQALTEALHELKVDTTNMAVKEIVELLEKDYLNKHNQIGGANND